MADVVVEPQPAASSDSKFPQQIEVAFTFKLTVGDQKECDYWLDTDTKAATLDAIGDIYDVLEDNVLTEIVSVNNLTPVQIQQAFAKREV